MKKLLLLLFCISMPVFAGDLTGVDTSNLSDAQITQLRADAAKIVAQNIAAKENGGLTAIVKDPDKAASFVSTWGVQTAAAAKGFAEALGVAAHELNINVNEFLGTPAGKLTAAIIIWKVFGTGLLHFLFGSLIIILAICTAKKIMFNFLKDEEIPTESTWFWGLYKTTKVRHTYKSIRDVNSEGEIFILIVSLVILIVGSWIGISIII